MYVFGKSGSSGFVFCFVHPKNKISTYRYIYKNLTRIESLYIYIYMYMMTSSISTPFISTHPYMVHLQAGSSIPQKLQTAYTMFKAFCKHSRATPFVKTFTRDNLGWDSFAKYPEASFKGSEVKLLLGFLVDFMYHDETHQVNQICCDALDAARCMWTTSSAWCLQWIGFFYREKKLQLL